MIKLAQTGLKFQTLLEGYLEQWVEGPERMLPATGAPEKQPSREHELLEQILQSDPAKAKQIRAILETYAEVAAARAGHKQTKAG